MLNTDSIVVDTPEAARATLVETEGISKRFGAVEALRAVSMRIHAGEIAGLVGENGAGKSTLLSVISGSLRPDSGRLYVHGSPVALRNYLQANKLGIFRVHQDPALVENLTVAENIFLGYESHFSRLGVVNRGDMAATVRHRLDETPLGKRIKPNDPIRSLSLDEREFVEIMRAISVAALLGVKTPVLLLDEPTASLSREEVDYLFGFLRDMRPSAAFVFVSHRLEEVLAISDRLYVMKDGQVTAELRPNDASTNELHRLMVGRAREEAYYRENERRHEFGPPLLEAKNLSAPRHFRGVSFALRAGEILGIAGVTGSGKTELGRALIGDIPIASGELLLRGRTIRNLDLRARVKWGLGYVPLDRHREGVILYQSLRMTNIPLAALGRISHFAGLISRGKEQRIIKWAIDWFRIAAPNGDALVSTLSGGNQQKVLLARWAVAGSRVLILDNPTRGVDVGAKSEIYSHLRSLTLTDVAILLISDDLHELMGLSDRIIIMRDGAAALEFEHAQGLQEHDLVAHMV